MITIFTSQARKAQIAAVLAFLAPILTFVGVEGDWSWRAFAAAVLSGVVAGLAVFQTPNQARDARGRFARDNGL